MRRPRGGWWSSGETQPRPHSSSFHCLCIRASGIATCSQLPTAGTCTAAARCCGGRSLRPARRPLLHTARRWPTRSPSACSARAGEQSSQCMASTAASKGLSRQQQHRQGHCTDSQHLPCSCRVQPAAAPRAGAGTCPGTPCCKRWRSASCLCGAACWPQLCSCGTGTRGGR